ncbi:MAG: hypothetical protein M1815_000337 [Lichina confinis]|nr:MAG: hypothetical protein M1815_000337 [Lichina confinis]
MHVLPLSLFALLTAGSLAAPADLRKRQWGYGNCENRQGEISDLYQRCIGNYRYTPLPPALYWGPKSPEACAKWVKDYTGCSTGKPEGKKPTPKQPASSQLNRRSEETLSKRQWGYGNCENRQGEISDLYQRCIGNYRYTPLPPALYWGPKSPEACAKWVKDYTGCSTGKPEGKKPTPKQSASSQLNRRSEETLSKRQWGYGNCETRQGEISDLYQKCIGNYRYTPLPPALYWGPKSPEACAKWVKDYTGCSTGKPEGEKPKRPASSRLNRRADEAEKSPMTSSEEGFDLAGLDVADIFNNLSKAVLQALKEYLSAPDSESADQPLGPA